MVGNALAVLLRIEIQVVISLVKIEACGVVTEVRTVVPVVVTMELKVSSRETHIVWRTGDVR